MSMSGVADCECLRVHFWQASVACAALLRLLSQSYAAGVLVCVWIFALSRVSAAPVDCKVGRHTWFHHCCNVL